MSVAANQIASQSRGCRRGYLVAAAIRLYQATLAFISANGYLTDTTGSGANRFAGLVVDEADNSAGAAGAIKGEVYREGEFLLTGSGFTQASVGQDAYASDNYTITAGAGAAGSVRIGEITEYVSATQVWVKLDTGSGIPAAGTLTKTADYTITAADSGKTFDSTGASGTITGALPAAVPGLDYYFRVGAAQQHRVDPNGTETISLPSTGVAGAAGKYLVADAAGETVHLKCIVAGTWSVVGYTGTWTAEA